MKDWLSLKSGTPKMEAFKNSLKSLKLSGKITPEEMKLVATLVASPAFLTFLEVRGTLPEEDMKILKECVTEIRETLKK